MTAAEADPAVEVERLRSELSDARDQQAAMAEMLRLITASPGDLQPVLRGVVERAKLLCAADDGSIGLFEGDAVTTMVHHQREQGGIGPRRLSRDTMWGAAILDAAPVQVVGTLDDFERAFPASGRRLRAETALIEGAIVTVPLLQDGRPVGHMQMLRARAVPFTDQQILLLETFATQAAIAIQNARLFEDTQRKTRDLEASTERLQEALDQQTATAEILAIVSSSPTDLQPVFVAVAERAQRLLAADTGTVALYEGDTARIVAVVGSTPVTALQLPVPGTYARSGDGSLFAESLRMGRTLHLYGTPDDVQHDAPAIAASWRAAGYARRTYLRVPLQYDGSVLGAIVVGGADGVPFTERQIAVLETFAAQVVIAMRNTRLFNELRQSNASLSEALEQQTATAGVLQAISRSAFDLPAVLHLLTDHAVRLCHADTGSLNRVLDGALQAQAAVGVLAENVHLLPPVTLKEGGDRSLVGRALASGRTEHIPDIAQDPALAGSLRAWVQIGLGHRTRLVVPLLRGQEVIGALGLWRMAVSPFSAREIALVETFADQAVIAIENARLIDEIREKSRQLEEASQHKSAFLSAMSHELRTPLNAVIGYSEILAEDAQDAGHTDMLPDLEKINASGKHLLSLISNVLDLSKIEAGKMDLAIEEFAVERLLGEVAAVVAPLIDKNSNRFVLETAGDLGHMHTDKTKLRQCLLNLLSNAAKFTEQGTITLQVIRESRPAGDWLSFAVEDTGIGMTDEQQSRLFEAFTQAEAGTSVRYGGSGLGLALTREFCRLLGGDIVVASRPGIASTFTLLLPSVVPTIAR